MTSPPHNGYRKGLPFQRWPDTCEGQCDLNTHRLHEEFTFLKVPVKVSVTHHTRATGRVHVLKATCQGQCDPTTHGLREKFTFLCRWSETRQRQRQLPQRPVSAHTDSAGTVVQHHRQPRPRQLHLHALPQQRHQQRHHRHDTGEPQSPRCFLAFCDRCVCQ